MMSKIVDLDWTVQNRYEIFENGDVVDLTTDTVKKISINGYGYRYVSLYNIEDKRSREISLHRLMAFSFIPKTKEDISYNRDYVHFKDFDRSNVSIDNLEWLNAIELSLKVSIHGHQYYDVKECLPFICRMLEKDFEPKTICSFLGLNTRTCSPLIGKIYRRQIYKDYTKKYKF